MANYKSTDVYQYLNYLETYLLGDLESLHQLSKQCEARERLESPVPQESQFITGSSTTTTQTTMAPGYKPASPSAVKVHPSGPESTEELPKFFRSTIPHSLTLFSTIDILGYLIGKGDSGATAENFTNFFAKSISDEERLVLVKVYRHGMAHGYFPKLGVGISYHSTNPNQLFFKDSLGALVLNVNKLEELVVDGLKAIKVDETLYPTMESQFQRLIADYESKDRKHIEKLKSATK